MVAQLLLRLAGYREAPFPFVVMLEVESRAWHGLEWIERVLSSSADTFTFHFHSDLLPKDLKRLRV